LNIDKIDLRGISMDFIDELRQFANRVEKLKDKIITEEATKTSFIMPFFQILGYDVFNPDEFLPEFTADVGIKKGEKVDYAILRDGEPLVLIEAKQCAKSDLIKAASQLYRYFGTTKAKFTILTNGLVYLFFTDLEEPNKMDSKPFFEFNILDFKESTVNELKKFKKQDLNIDNIMNTASELKYQNEIKQLMQKILYNPSDEFINYILAEIYIGRKTQGVVDKFRPIITKSVNQFINELMNDRIKAALDQSSESEQPKQDILESAPEAPIEEESKIVTTMEELESFFIIKSILREVVPVEKISHKDTLSYFGILYDNNTWKWICRLYLKENVKYLAVPDEHKKEKRIEISNVQDIYQHSELLCGVVKRYL